MQKRTTNYSFQKFGDVFYSVNHNAGHLVDYVENDFKITNKSFDSFYYSSDPVYLDTKSGIIMLVVSKDGKKFEEYVIHRVVRLKPDIYFNYVSILQSQNVNTFVGIIDFKMFYTVDLTMHFYKLLDTLLPC